MDQSLFSIFCCLFFCNPDPPKCIYSNPLLRLFDFRPFWWVVETEPCTNDCHPYSMTANSNDDNSKAIIDWPKGFFVLLQFTISFYVSTISISTLGRHSKNRPTQITENGRTSPFEKVIFFFQYLWYYLMASSSASTKCKKLNEIPRSQRLPFCLDFIRIFAFSIWMWEVAQRVHKSKDTKQTHNVITS